jgi:nucleotide-binding universal stress UspA family protein
MIEIQRILCPIDFSEYSRHAVDHAVALARQYESTITALHVFPTMPVMAYAPGMPGVDPIVLTPVLQDQLLVDLKGFIETESAPGVPMKPLIREGDPVSEILSQATDMKADLLVMGTHGRSGFERLLLGSVTEKILRKASCPVLTVPRRHPDAVPATPVLFKRILCPVDFSDCSLESLEYALSLAQEADAQLTVLHVIGDELVVTPDAYGAIIMNDLESLADFRKRHERCPQASQGGRAGVGCRVLQCGDGGVEGCRAKPRDLTSRGCAADRLDCGRCAGSRGGGSRVLRIDNQPRRPGGHVSGAHSPSALIPLDGRAAGRRKVASIHRAFCLRRAEDANVRRQGLKESGRA